MSNANENFIMLPTVDICFKELMKNENVRRGFIAALMGVPPEKIRRTVLKDGTLPPEYGTDKLGLLDVKVILGNGVQIDIEMQVAFFAHWDARVLFYLSRMISGQLGKGEAYGELKKCIHVGILDFVHFPEDREWYHSIFLVDEKTGKRYTELLEIRILELKKLPEEVENEDILIRWMRFLGGKNREELERMAKTDMYIEEAYQDLLRFSADETKRELYEAREKALRDYNSQMQSAREYGFQKGYNDGREAGMEAGMEVGMKAGIQTEKKRMVEKKLARGKSPDQIAEELEEDLETIYRLIKEVEESVPSGV